MRAPMLLSVGALLMIPVGAGAQTGAPSRTVEDEFIEPGWFGVLEEAGVPPWLGRFAAEGSGFRVTSGPPAAYFHIANADEAAFREVTGDYTVKATFRETFLALSEEPQPYGLAISAERVDSPATTYLYCAAYGNGTFVVGGAAPGLTPFGMNPAGPVPHPAVHKAAAAGADVTQEITLSVKDGSVRCTINGTVVASYEHAAVVGPGRLASTDGVYGVYVGRNTEVVVTNLAVTTP